MTPYGWTKFFIEEISRDIQKADPEWKIIFLRYAIASGAHESGKLGEDPRAPSASLLLYLTKGATRRLPQFGLSCLGFPTPDGTGIDDYIHVMDLADGNVAALNKLFSKEYTGCTAYNLGTGYGKSVLEMVAAFERACGKKIGLKLRPMLHLAEVRPNAIGRYVSVEKAEKELGWKAKYGIEEMCRDYWNWATRNPKGYNSKSRVEGGDDSAYLSDDTQTP